MRRGRWSGKASRRRDTRRSGQHSAGDDGSASLEFITTGILLLLPLVYLILTMAALQGAAFAVEGAARQGARVFTQADNIEAANAAARRATTFALEDYGLESAPTALTVTCSPDPDDCLRRAGTVTVTVTVSVVLPLVPPVLDLSVPLSVPVEASATQTVSRFRADG